MTDPALDLALRRARLLERSAALRTALVDDARAFLPALRAVDAGAAGWRWLRAHPQWLVGAAVALAVARPRRGLRWAMRGWSAWRIYRKFKAGT